MRSSTIATLQEFVSIQKGWKYFKIKQDYQQLQKGYRARSLQGYSSEAQVKAYVFSRLPATYAVAYKLIKNHLSNLPIKSVIDWGCGVGAASLALADIIDNPIDYHLIESDNFALGLAHEFMQVVHGSKHYLHTAMPEYPVDLAIMSYSLNELGGNWQEVVEKLWEKANYLLIIEPGTHAIFQNLLRVRDYLIDIGAYVLAPCLHQKVCPLAQTDDWCHFQERLERTKALRFLKQAERGFEDEAYSYILLSKQASTKNNANSGRVIARPMQHGGHVNLKLCRDNGTIENVIISKKHEGYKQAKKLEWGDVFDYQ